MSLHSFGESIKSILIQHLENETFEYLFRGIIKFEDFITQIVFEQYKEAYLSKSSRSSLRSYIPTGQTFDADYQNLKRTLTFSNYYKEREMEDLASHGIDARYLKGLETHVTENMEEKIKGHSLNEINVLQLETMNKLKIIKSLVSKRIVSSKKVSNSRFVEMHKELDDYYLLVKKQLTDENFFFHLINLYDIEREYSIDLSYRIATYIDETKLKQYNFDNLVPLLTITISDINFMSANRFLMNRHIFINDLVSNDQKVFDQLVAILYWKAVLVSHFKDKIEAAYQKLNIILVEDHLKEKYDLFNLLIRNKEWNRNKIKIVRSFYDKFLANTEYPEIRT